MMEVEELETAPDIPVIDAHVHFWEYEKGMDSWINNRMKILRQDYLPPQLAATLARNGVAGCIAVQARQEELETFYLVELAASFPVIKGVVGWVDLCSADIDERLSFFSDKKAIRGWRHIVQDEAPGFMAAETFRRGISKLQHYNYAYDLLVYPHQLSEAVSLTQAFPDQRFILDHCAKPAIAKKEMDDWAVGIRDLASHPHVYCKLSGLFTEAKWKDWSAADFYPWLDVVFDAFGVQRLVFGSDWPVMLLSGIYVQWKSLLEKYMENHSPEDRAAVFGGNAIRFYQL